MDVSNSVDRHEFRYQVDGLAEALLDIDVIHVLTRDQVALTVVQWSGPNEQIAALPWKRMRTEDDVLDFSQQTREMEREFVFSKTALGDALAFSISLFDDVQDCTRRVIDVSGDGVSNTGLNVANQSEFAAGQGIEINGVAIDIMGNDVTEYYNDLVITPGGFVLTATGFDDYPRAMRAKLLRELVKPSS